jgi:hypothetical protein
VKTVVALAVALACACAASPAGAAFPGHDGLIATVFDQFDRGGGLDVNLRLLDRHGKTMAMFSRCFRDDESEPVTGDCPADPAFFPDGRRIALGLGRRLALQDVAGGAPVVLPKLTDSDSDPYPSPDGRELVFSGRLSGRRDLFTVHVDGTGLRRLTRAGGASPAWSSRGEIAFSARKKIWRMRPGGKRRFVASGSRPDWSPSGSTLLYLYRRSIYRVPRGGGVRRRLVHGSAISAAFSSDARSIAFGREVDIGGSLNTAMSSNGAGVRRIRSGGELPVGSTWLRWEAPAWQPGG